MLQLQRNQKTEDGQDVKHQDHFCCMITCGYCGKRWHYDDACHIKRRKSEKLQQAEGKRRKNVGKGNPEGGGRNPGGSSGKANLGGGRRASTLPTDGRGAPNPTPKGEQPRVKRIVPSTHGAGGAEKGENAWKHKLNGHSKCLHAAGVEVNCPEEG